MSDVLSVFVSSTYVDLREHRAAVIRVLLDAGFHPVGMENFMARDEEPTEACLEEVAQADLFVGIYAWRYGFVPPDGEVSITEQELLKAEEEGKPRFCFFVDESHPWPEQLREGGAAPERLRALKARIGGGRVVTWFTTPEILAGKVIASLHRHATSRRKASMAAATPERRELLLLLDKVEGAWLRDVLERSAPESRRIALELEERPGAVEPASEAEREVPTAPSLIHGEEVLELFLERERSLLILGEMGSGKTITLLLLAQGLAEQARSSPGEPIPVVLNLASWAERRLPLGEWMVHEIRARYQTGEKAARGWLREHCILPLLDGLDEVEAECRAECVRAINAWLADHGLHGLAVCCRTGVYEALPRRLRLSAAVALRPLDPAQIEGYVAAAPAGEALRAALDADGRLRELASTPQVLSLVEKAVRDDAGALTGNKGSLSQDRLFGTYVDLRLKKRPFRSYPRERTLRALSWLARRMKEHGSSLFGLEQLQPSWLSGLDRWIYFFVTRILAGVLLVLPVALWRKSPLLLAFGLAAGALAGGFDGAGWRGKLPRSARLAGFAAVILLLFLAGGIDSAGSSENKDVILGTALFTSLFGLTLGWRSAQRHDSRDDVQVSEAFVWSWSWSWTGIGALAFPFAGVVLMWAVNWLDKEAARLSWKVLAFGAVIFCPVGFVAGGFLGGLRRGVIAKKVRPNEGIRLTLKNAGKIALFVAPVAFLVFLALTFGTLDWQDLLLSGAILGFWVGLGYGGLDVLQHYVLRTFLCLRGYAPADYVGFLNYAADAGLLLRSGGSYLFFYGQPMLEHLASRPDDEAREAVG